ncbi:hypothetical protein C5167_050978 [Papaver somniferum]|uniref:Uncharacterized protein n=1 Tax=Papaver somniferum TaxID=3469 RepID=A0A4Y7KTK0_PAPSO|nr:hypothetical protein C5167_050978 [Papaver somniferum]
MARIDLLVFCGNEIWSLELVLVVFVCLFGVSVVASFWFLETNARKAERLTCEVEGLIVVKQPRFSFLTYFEVLTLFNQVIYSVADMSSKCHYLQGWL